MSNSPNMTTKTYDIRSSPNSLKTKSSIHADLTPRRVESSRDSYMNVRGERVESSERFVNNKFNYENYFEDENDAKNFKLPPVQQALKPEPVLNNDSGIEASVKKVKQRSAVQMINDLTHLSKNISHEKNVHFYYNNSENVLSVHSLILFVRSAWFRRSWRMAGDMSNSLYKDKYNFEYNSAYGIGKNIEISMINELPQQPNGEFNFKIDLNQDQGSSQFHEAFKQFKQFLYRGDCEINGSNSLYLTVLAEAFKIDSLKSYLSIYYQSSISSSNIDGLIQTVQLAYLFGIEDLKAACILMINKNAIVVVNAASWKKLASENPNLVLEIFSKN